MVDKYLYRDSGTGLETERAGTVTGGTNAEAGKIPALASDGRLDPTLMPVGIAADTYSGTAFENISAGAFVYIKPDGSVANASADVGGIEAVGFVLGGGNAGDTVLVYFEGRNTALSGLSVGVRYYLSDTTPGGARSTPIPSGAGKKHQFLGRAITSTSIGFEADDPIVLA